MPADLPTTMHAVLLTGHGGLDKLDYRTDVPVPRPGARDVLIRIGAAGVNNTDINTRIGWYSKGVRDGTTTRGALAGAAGAAAEDAGWSSAPLQFPRIQGIDVCGTVVAVGSAVAPGRIGERVLVEPCLRVARPGGGTDLQFLGSECDGGFAQYVAVPAAHAYAIDSALDDAALASFPCAYSTAENLLSRAGLRAGETVLITGASGGVGSAAVQLAALRQAEVIAVTSPAKAAAVAALGATRCLARDDDPVDALGPDSVDVVIDLVGGDQWPRLLDVLARRGRYAVAGAIGGPMVSLDLRTLYLKDLSFFGCTELGPRVFADLIAHIADGGLRPVVAQTYRLRDIAQAQQDFLEKRHTGKLVLIPPGD